MAEIKNQYRTSAGYQMDDRPLLLRGGIYDGRTWVGVVKIGQRVFCGGDDPWSTEGLYLVLPETEELPDGVIANLAVPAYAA